MHTGKRPRLESDRGLRSKGRNHSRPPLRRGTSVATRPPAASTRYHVVRPVFSAQRGQSARRRQEDEPVRQRCGPLITFAGTTHDIAALNVLHGTPYSECLAVTFQIKAGLCGARKVQLRQRSVLRHTGRGAGLELPVAARLPVVRLFVVGYSFLSTSLGGPCDEISS